MAPAARIAVVQLFNVQQSTLLAQDFNDNVIGFEDKFAVQRRIGTRQITAVRANRVRHFKTVFLADNKVIWTMARCGMYSPRTGIKSHVITQNRRNVEAQERVLEAQQLQISAFALTQNGPLSDTRTLHHALN